LRNAASRAGIDHCVRFLGSVFGDAKWNLWQESDVFTFPTWHKEGLPYALLEAMAAGCVPITTAVGAIPDVIQDGVHGQIMPVKNPAALAAAIASLAQDRQRLAKMANACRKRVADSYSITRLSATIGKLYRDIQSGLPRHSCSRNS
jgi:glycosyltransferase involved in cell wall biosynthesis